MHWIGNFDRTSPLTWVTLAVGAAFILTAWRMDAAWFDAHIVPDFFRSRHSQWTVTTAIRASLALVGLLTILVARPLLVRRTQGLGALKICFAAFAMVGAVAAAIVSSELVLRTQQWRYFLARTMHEEPRRQADEHLGWDHVPGRTGSDLIGGRRITYSFDSHGYRVSRPGAETDLAAPSILFTGESTMLGYGLDWDETIPARVGAELGVPTANLAVAGYSTDQTLMLLRPDLPRFGCPLGVVSIFMPSFLDRNLNTDRPHLDEDLRWQAPHVGLRLAMMARHALSYRSAGSIDHGIALTSTVLRATKAMAQSHGAWTLVVVPTFMPEPRAEQTIRRRVLDDAGIEYVHVPLDPKLRIDADGHPDRRAAAIIGSALVARLAREGLAGTQRLATKSEPCPARSLALPR